MRSKIADCKKLKLNYMSVDLKIRVTKEIIFKAKDCNSNFGFNCPIALAIRDILPDAAVGNSFILPLYNTKGYESVIYLSPAATNFITRFDNSIPEDRLNLLELEFTITIPDEVIETIDIESLRPSLINHPTLELI